MIYSSVHYEKQKKWSTLLIYCSAHKVQKVYKTVTEKLNSKFLNCLVKVANLKDWYPSKGFFLLHKGFFLLHKSQLQNSVLMKKGTAKKTKNEEKQKRNTAAKKS